MHFRSCVVIQGISQSDTGTFVSSSRFVINLIKEQQDLRLQQQQPHSTRAHNISRDVSGIYTFRFACQKLVNISMWAWQVALNRRCQRHMHFKCEPHNCGPNSHWKGDRGGGGGGQGFVVQGEAGLLLPRTTTTLALALAR